MFNLIRKDLSANARYMLIGLIIFVVYAFIFTENGDGLFMLCLALLFYTVTMTNLTIDERYKIELLLTTLPIKRKDVVLSKYLMIPVLFAASIVLYTILLFGSKALAYNTMPVLTMTSAMFGLFAVSLFNGVLLPLSYRFGAQSMRYVGLVIFFVFFFLSSFLSHFNLSGSISIFANMNDTQIGVILLIMAVLVSAVSFAFSYSIYAKKDF